MWDVSTAKKQDSGLDKATDLFKTLLDSGVCVRRHVRLVPDICKFQQIVNVMFFLDLPLARECVFHCLVKKNNVGLLFLQIRFYFSRSLLTILAKLLLKHLWLREKTA